MPTTVLDPTSEGAYTAFSAQPSGSKVGNVTDDSDSFWVEKGTSDGRQSFIQQNLPAAAGLIVTHTINFRAWRVGSAPTMAAFLRLSGTDSDGAQKSLSVFPTPSNQTEVDLARPGGGSWAPADVDAAEIGIVSSGVGASTNVACHNLDWSVEWSEVAAGGFAYLLAEWVPLLLGYSGLSALEIYSILKRAQLKTTPSCRKDFSVIKEALRRRPRFIFQGALPC